MNSEFGPIYCDGGTDETDVTCVTDVTDVTSVTMSDLNIRNCPDKLIIALKSEAAVNRVTLRQFVIQRLAIDLGVDLESYGGEDVKMVAERSARPSRNNRQVGEAAKEREMGVYANTEVGRKEVGKVIKRCPRCEKPLTDWGSQMRCVSCQENFTK